MHSGYVLWSIGVGMSIGGFAVPPSTAQWSSRPGSIGLTGVFYINYPNWFLVISNVWFFLVCLWSTVSQSTSTLGAQPWRIWFSGDVTEFCGLQTETLKNLVIRSCSSRVADILVIRAPSLASLRLDLLYNTHKSGVLLDTEKFLVKASISLASDQLSQRGEAILLGSLFSVTSLELGGFNAMV